jgi:hypothetical protein
MRIDADVFFLHEFAPGEFLACEGICIGLGDGRIAVLVQFDHGPGVEWLRPDEVDGWRPFIGPA